MLVISRKTEESIIINDNIEITVLEINKDRIRLGINAPKDIQIARKEIYITELENKQASEVPSIDIVKKLLESRKEK